MIMAKQYYQGKEVSKRPMLHKLAQKIKSDSGYNLQDVDHN